jgi:hypothetical protein
MILGRESSDAKTWRPSPFRARTADKQHRRTDWDRLKEVEVTGRRILRLRAPDNESEGTMTSEKVRTEEFRVSGEELLARIKGLVHEGNIRRIVIKNKEGGTVMEIPLTMGVVGALLVPTLAAVGAIAALLTEATVVVEKAETN